MRRTTCLFFLAAALCGAAQGRANHYFAWVGTYTGPNSKGIYALRFDASAGILEAPTLAGEIVNPTFLALHPKRDVLYAVSELGNDGRSNGSVSAFRMDRRTGSLTLLNTVSSGGGGACHLVADRTGRMLIVANYGSGSTASFPILPDGRLGALASLILHSGSSLDPRRQRGPHAHAVVISPDNRFVFVPDLGLDRILVYRIDPATATLAPHDPPYVDVKKGSGPRHFAFHPSGRYAYALSEMGSMVTVFSYDGRAGRLTSLQTISTLPAGFDGENNSGEIEVDAAGRFLYASNRGHDSITVFSIDDANGMLKTVQNISTGGSIPRNFKIDPTGRYLLAANQKSNNITVFSVDSKTGRLAPTGQKFDVPSPACVIFTPRL